MKKTLIFYQSGCYGSFVTWLLKNVNVPIDEIKLPFQKDGSAHQSLDILTKNDVTDLENFLTSEDILPFHYPHDSHSWAKTMEIFTNYKKYNIVTIDFDFYSHLQLMNNNEDKISNCITRDEEFLSLLAGWGTPPYDTWQIRECLSCHFNIFKAQLLNQRMKTIRDVIKMYPNVGFYFDISELRDNFEEITKRLCDFCNIEYLTDTIKYIKTQWFLSQKHLYKDSIANSIVNNIVDNKDFVITDQLSLIDEAYVQHKLRDRGIGLKCYNLNEFPKTNAEFQELLYYNFDTLITNNFNGIIEKFYNKQISHDAALLQISNILKKLDV